MSEAVIVAVFVVVAILYKLKFIHIDFSDGPSIHGEDKQPKRLKD